MNIVHIIKVPSTKWNVNRISLIQQVNKNILYETHDPSLAQLHGQSNFWHEFSKYPTLTDNEKQYIHHKF